MDRFGYEGSGIPVKNCGAVVGCPCGISGGQQRGSQAHQQHLEPDGQSVGVPSSVCEGSQQGAQQASLTQSVGPSHKGSVEGQQYCLRSTTAQQTEAASGLSATSQARIGAITRTTESGSLRSPVGTVSSATDEQYRPECSGVRAPRSVRRRPGGAASLTAAVSGLGRRSYRAFVAGDRSSANASGPASVLSSIARAGLILVLAAWTGLVLIRFTGPPDLMDHDQARPAMYALDIVVNGNWLCQRDPDGAISSKPPFWTWLVALISAPAGGVSIATLYLPGAIAVLIIALITRSIATRVAGPIAGLFAAMCLLLSWYGARHAGLARTDAVFSACVTSGAMLALRGWLTGRGWTWFWLASAAATLAKGPVGLVLAACGLLAAAWERYAGAPSPLRGRTWPGVALFLAITLGWFAAAYARFGPPLIDKMIWDELVGHAAPSERGIPGGRLYLPPVYFIAYFVPWSVPAVIGLWRAIAHPPAHDETRRTLRFVACWFLGGLAIFSIAPHQRPDLLLPILPAASILAGCEITHWRGKRPARRAVAGAAVVAAFALAGFTYYYHRVRADDITVRNTMGVRDLARELRATPGGPPRILTVGETNTFQFFLGTADRRLSIEEVCQALAGSERLLVAVGRHEGFGRAARERGLDLVEVARGPAHGRPFVVVYANRPGPAEQTNRPTGGDQR